MAPSKFALQANLNKITLSDRETLMLRAVFEVAATQINTPDTKEVINFKEVGKLIGIASDPKAEKAKKSVMDFLENFDTRKKLARDESKLLWAIAKVAGGALNVDYGVVGPICKISYGKNARQSAKRTLEKIAKGNASLQIILTHTDNPPTEYRKGPRVARALGSKTEEDDEDNDYDDLAGQEPVSELAQSTRTSTRISAKRKAFKAGPASKLESTNIKTVNNGQLVHRKKTRLSHTVSSGANHEQSEDMKDVENKAERNKGMGDESTQDYLTNDKYDLREKSPELIATSSSVEFNDEMKEFEDSCIDYDPPLFENNGEVENYVEDGDGATENDSQVETRSQNHLEIRGHAAEKSCVEIHSENRLENENSGHATETSRAENRFETRFEDRGSATENDQVDNRAEDYGGVPENYQGEKHVANYGGAPENSLVQSLGLEQPNYPLLKSILHQAALDQPEKVAEMAQYQQTQMVARLQPDPLQLASSTLRVRLFDGECEAPLSQADIDAARECQMPIEKYMEWRVVNKYTPTYARQRL